MSSRVIYVVLLIIVISVLRYIGYRRSKRVEEKLDLILNALGVDPESGTKNKGKLLSGDDVKQIRSATETKEKGGK